MNEDKRWGSDRMQEDLLTDIRRMEMELEECEKLGVTNSYLACKRDRALRSLAAMRAHRRYWDAR